MRVRALFAALLAGAVVMGAAPAQAGSNVITAMKFVRALNQGDLDAHMSYFSSTPTIIEEGQRPIRGRAAVRRDAKEEIEDGLHVVLSQLRAAGDTVTARFRVTFEGIEEIGIRRIVGWVTFTFEGDKIDRLNIRLDHSDAQTRKAMEAFEAGG